VSATKDAQGATGGEAKEEFLQASLQEAQHGGLSKPNLHGITKGVTSEGVLGEVEQPQTLEVDRSVKEGAEKVKKTTFKRVRVVAREGKAGELGSSVEGSSVGVGQKRCLVEETVEVVGGVKKGRLAVDNVLEGLGASNFSNAGLSEQSCEKQ
jgi:hypothetical protein